jgi:hypothetical protein
VLLDVPPGAGLISVRNPNRAHPACICISTDVRAKAISNYEGTVKAMTLGGRMSTPRFERDLEAALAKAIQAPMRHDAGTSR